MSNQLALVTGASSGVGYHLARIFAENGFDLVIASEGPGLAKTEADLSAFGATVTSLRTDLSTREGCVALWQQIEKMGRPLDAAAINAGVGLGGLFVDTDLDAELKMVGLNVGQYVCLSKYVLKQMVGRGQGKVLLTASLVAEMVSPREAVYAASKAFVLSFAKSLHAELEDTGVTVTALQPGPINTNFFHRAGMDQTLVGTKGKLENESADVARQGFEAMMKGEKHVYASSVGAKIGGAVANFIPGAVTAAMHEKLAKPLKEES